MLNHVIKIAIYFSFLILLGCTGNSKTQIVKFDNLEVLEIRHKSLEKSLLIVGNEEYFRIYKCMNDSIRSWVTHKLVSYSYLNSYEIDSTLCINKSRTKLVCAILDQCTQNNCVQEYIKYFYGVKIKDKWYFFDGPTMVLPRENYQEDIHTPLSFDKLKQIATKHIYSRYLKKTETGVWEIDDDFFDDLTSVAWCTHCNTSAQWDSTYLRIIKNNWSKKALD